MWMGWEGRPQKECRSGKGEKMYGHPHSICSSPSPFHRHPLCPCPVHFTHMLLTPLPWWVQGGSEWGGVHVVPQIILGKSHLTTWHSWFGISAFVGYVGLAFAGAIGLHPDFGVFRTNKTIRTLHKWSGTALTFVGWTACVLGFVTMENNFTQQVHAPSSQYPPPPHMLPHTGHGGCGAKWCTPQCKGRLVIALLAWGWLSLLHRPTMALIQSQSGLGWSVIPGLQPCCQGDWSVFFDMVCTNARPWSPAAWDCWPFVCGMAAYRHGTGSQYVD